MSSIERERDTQFAEWSGLLFDELMGIDDVDDVKKCISRRAYDLAQFIVSQVYADDLKPKEILCRNGKPVLMYPENLKEWYAESGIQKESWQRMNEPISENAFNTLPQAIRDWIQELGWKREDITSVHVNYGNPLVVTINKGQERQFCNFVKLDNGQLKKA